MDTYGVQECAATCGHQTAGSAARTFTFLIGVLLVISILFPSSLAAAPTQPPRDPAIKNIIILIADGWGFGHLEASSYYRYGLPRQQIFHSFPFQHAMSTYMTYSRSDRCYGRGYDPERAWTDFDYVKTCYTDSAAAATAMSTGTKTHQGAVGVDFHDEPLLHAMELAEAKGKATGVVTSMPWTHATPAAFVAHNADRTNYEAIGVEMVYDSALDVIMGAGHPFFDDDGRPTENAITYAYVGGQSTWKDLVAGQAGGDADGDGDNDRWVLIQTRAQFRALAYGRAPKRVLGTVEVHHTLQQRRSGDELADPFVVPLNERVPTLATMTKAALNVLDADPEGFVLLVESGAVDWAGNRNQSGRAIEEQIAFEMAVEAVVKWVEAKSDWGESLVIVTADHETGYVTGPDSDPGWTAIVNNGEGRMPGMEWHSIRHANRLVPIYANGDAGWILNYVPTRHDPVYGRYIDNTDVAKVLFAALDPRLMAPGGTSS